MIDYVRYNPGKFFAAYEEKASTDNEQTEIGLTTPDGKKVIFKQIAGLIARRIVCRLHDGDTVRIGDRMGMIRFGSRADVIISADSKLNVSIGDHVAGGKTVLGFLPGPELADSRRINKGENVEL